MGEYIRDNEEHQIYRYFVKRLGKVAAQYLVLKGNLKDQESKKPPAKPGVYQVQINILSAQTGDQTRLGISCRSQVYSSIRRDGIKSGELVQ